MHIDDAFAAATKAAAQGNYSKAEECYLMALADVPDHPEVLRAYAQLLGTQHREGEALKLLNLAVALEPMSGVTHALLGACHGALGNQKAAERHNSRALVLAPDMPTAQWNRALHRLLHGDYRNGWTSYRWGKVCGKGRRMRTLKPEWDGTGSPKNLLVWAEQGLGDTIMMFRFMRDVRDRVGPATHLILEVQRELLSLVCGCPDVDEVVGLCEDGSVPVCGDYEHVSLMSLPEVLGLYQPSEFWRGPYLSCDGPKHGADEKLRVGVCWKGSSGHVNDHRRSLSVDERSSLCDGLSASAAWSLVPGDDAEGRLLLPDLSTFEQTRRTIAALELVITVDTAVAHLAGAMGKPVWILLPYACDWRWDLNYPNSTPWYPSAVLFRQRTGERWPAVIGRVHSAFERLAAGL